LPIIFEPASVMEFGFYQLVIYLLFNCLLLVRVCLFLTICVTGA